MKLNLVLNCLFAFVALGVGSAQATPTSYTDRTQWAAHSDITSTHDFNSGSGQASHGQSYTDSGVTYRASSGIYSIYDIGYDAVYHHNGYLDLQGSSIGMNFAAPVTAFGFDFGAFYDNAVTLNITLSDGSLFTATAPSSAYSFFGVTSDVALTSVSFTTTNNFTAFDNLSLGNATNNVPEPTSLALLALGIVALGATRQKKAV